MKLRRLILLSLSFIFGTNKSYIYHISQYHNLINLGDVHYGAYPGLDHPNLNTNEIDKINKSQIKDIINLINKSGTKNSVVLIEDMYDYVCDPTPDNFLKNTYLENQKKGYSSLLSILNQETKKHNIQTINLDFRQHFSLFFCNLKTVAKDFLNHLDGLMKEIQSYNDSPFLDNYYKEVIDDINKNEEFLKILNENQDKFMNEFISKNKHNKNLMENFLKDYHRIFDVKLLHTIYDLNKNNKKIFIVVGNLHIENIEPLLDKIGFEFISKKDSINPQTPLNIDSSIKINDIDYQFDFKEFLVNFGLIVMALLIPGLIIEFIYMNTRKTIFNNQGFKN